MYISLNWIKDYVDLDGIDIMNLINNRFTLAVAEVEGVEVKGADLSGVVTAKIVSVADHPNSKKLHLLKVDKGDEVVDIVCGAPNVREGMIIPLATLGAKLGEITIGTATLGGCISNGMCCSAKELGISDDHSGLYEFAADTKLGVDVKSILPIEDIRIFFLSTPTALAISAWRCNCFCSPCTGMKNFGCVSASIILSSS